jgi:hypothetical protein
VKFLPLHGNEEVTAHTYHRYAKDKKKFDWKYKQEKLSFQALKAQW